MNLPGWDSLIVEWTPEPPTPRKGNSGTLKIPTSWAGLEKARQIPTLLLSEVDIIPYKTVGICSKRYSEQSVSTWTKLASHSGGCSSTKRNTVNKTAICFLGRPVPQLWGGWIDPLQAFLSNAQAKN